MTKEEILGKMAGYTPFQQAVWKACMEIPAGQTRSYKWIAERIGRPGAARAVGGALGKNPFAPDVPCHRVIKADGTPGGFSAPGGVRAKLNLLEAEKKAARPAAERRPETSPAPAHLVIESLYTRQPSEDR